MDLLTKFLLKILRLGAVVIFIGRLETADQIYEATRGLPEPFADIFAVAVIGIIIAAAKALEE